LPNLNDNPDDSFVWGRHISKPQNYPICSSCTPSERRLELNIVDPQRTWVDAHIVLRYYEEIGVEYLEAVIFSKETTVVPDNGTPAETRFPFGTFIFIKQ
jgi:hypothetical protein